MLKENQVENEISFSLSTGKHITLSDKEVSEIRNILRRNAVFDNHWFDLSATQMGGVPIYVSHTQKLTYLEISHIERNCSWDKWPTYKVFEDFGSAYWYYIYSGKTSK